MKKFMEFIVQFKFVWGLFFTAAILLYSIFNLFIGNSTMEFIVVWQFVLITMILTLMHYAIFGDFIFKSRALKCKVLIHFPLCYITVFIFADWMNWINISNINSISIFTLTYVFLYLALMFSFYIYYKTTGEELNNRLTSYKQKRNIIK